VGLGFVREFELPTAELILGTLATFIVGAVGKNNLMVMIHKRMAIIMMAILDKN
jgi:hypothetical protein